ncbi:hypothetical protein KCU61_g102, partial [Aureobasidium melanogenum]
MGKEMQDPWSGVAEATVFAAAPFVVPFATTFGFDAISLERSGRDEVGIGGGVADSGRAVGTAGAFEAALKPIVNADLFGAAGSGGLEGSCGLAGSCTAGNTVGEDLVCCSTGPRSGRLGVRLGGKGSNVDASKEGARIVKSGPELLVAELIPVRVDAVEIEDLVDTIDSLDCFLSISGLPDMFEGVSEGLLGGSCGAGPDGCLGGSLGAALLAGGTLVVCCLDGRSGLLVGTAGGPAFPPQPRRLPDGRLQTRFLRVPQEDKATAQHFDNYLASGQFSRIDAPRVRTRHRRACGVLVFSVLSRVRYSSTQHNTWPNELIIRYDQHLFFQRIAEMHRPGGWTSLLTNTHPLAPSPDAAELQPLR